ncbi:MAG: type B 50S ribosomal protein L31 [Cryobacterium sp.]|nr:type B 50S ribosomal protein L31 [Oligoflexia bacterium]
MKQAIHPEYKEIAIKDMSSGFTFLTRSTRVPTETIEFEGKQYPVLKVEVSSKSHPFYTGQERIMDTAGRIEKFNRRYKK